LLQDVIVTERFLAKHPVLWWRVVLIYNEVVEYIQLHGFKSDMWYTVSFVRARYYSRRLDTQKADPN
jgi:hypothetical protein